MVQDPCDPLPSTYIPSGLSLHRQHAAVQGVGHAKTAPLLQSHAVAAIPPVYVGCDHRNPAGNGAWHVNAVHFPAAVDLPATILLPSTNVTVATLANASPVVLDYRHPAADIPVSMPEPSGAILFLFAVFLVWTARRFEARQVVRPVTHTPRFRLSPTAKHRHRSKSIAPYCAFRLQPS